MYVVLPEGSMVDAEMVRLSPDWNAVNEVPAMVGPVQRETDNSSYISLLRKIYDWFSQP